MIGLNDLCIFFNGVNLADVGTGTGHPVFANEKFIRRRTGRNNFGVRFIKRNSLSHDTCHARRRDTDKIFGNGVNVAENFRRGISVVFGVGSIQICAGRQRIRDKGSGVRGQGKIFGGGTVQARCLDERAQPESVIIFLGIPAAVRQPVE